MEETKINQITSPTPRKKSKPKLGYWILGIVLVLALGYIGYEKYSEYRYDKDEEIYQKGAYLGYNQAVLQVVEQVNTCKSAPINYRDKNGNHTINILKLECLSDEQLGCLF